MLKAAAQSYARRDTKAAKNQLEAFINQVSAQGGKKIPAPDADRLLARARRIVRVLGD